MPWVQRLTLMCVSKNYIFRFFFLIFGRKFDEDVNPVFVLTWDGWDAELAKRVPLQYISVMAQMAVAMGNIIHIYTRRSWSIDFACLFYDVSVPVYINAMNE